MLLTKSFMYCVKQMSNNCIWQIKFAVSQRVNLLIFSTAKSMFNQGILDLVCNVFDHVVNKFIRV